MRRTRDGAGAQARRRRPPLGALLALLLAAGGCALLVDAADEREVEGCVDTGQCPCGEVCVQQDEFTRACVAQACGSNNDCAGCFPASSYKCIAGQCSQCNGIVRPDGSCLACELGRPVCGQNCCNHGASCYEPTDGSVQCCDSGVVCGSQCCNSALAVCEDGACSEL